MKSHVLSAAVAIALAALITPQPSRASDVPPMGGDYKNVVAIPVDDPAVNAIAGALTMPEGTGPFPVVVYIPPCGGPNFPLELAQEKIWIEQLRSKGIASLIVDPFVPRGLAQGNCDKVLTVLADVQNKNEAVLNILAQGGSDAAAAVKAVKTMPGIDPDKVFLMGLSYGATASLYAQDPKAPGEHATGIAGVVAYFPLCDSNAEATVPTLIMIGDKDDWTGPVAACEGLRAKSNFDVVVYPGATHAFTMPFEKQIEVAGHILAHDAAATKDAAARTMAFIEAHAK